MNDLFTAAKSWKWIKWGMMALLAIVTGLAAAPSIAADSNSPIYQLDKGDVFKMTVFGEEDLSGEFSVDSTGSVAIPLVGDIHVLGMSIRDAEKAIADRLRGGFLRNPRVSIQVLTYRPFYVMGEVNKAGSYPYNDGMRISNAVAVAGGFTYRADEKDIIITRNDDKGGKKEIKAGLDTPVLPGDVIRVKERFF